MQRSRVRLPSAPLAQTRRCPRIVGFFCAQWFGDVWGTGWSVSPANNGWAAERARCTAVGHDWCVGNAPAPISGAVRSPSNGWPFRPKSGMVPRRQSLFLGTSPLWHECRWIPVAVGGPLCLLRWVSSLRHSFQRAAQKPGSANPPCARHRAHPSQGPSTRVAGGRTSVSAPLGIPPQTPAPMGSQ